MFDRSNTLIYKNVYCTMENEDIAPNPPIVHSSYVKLTVLATVCSVTWYEIVTTVQPF